MDSNVVLHGGLITYPNFVLIALSSFQTLWDTKSSLFWNITPYSPLKVNRHFGGTCRFHLQVRTETSVDFQQTTRRYISEGITLHICGIHTYVHPFYYPFLCKRGKGSFSPRKEICLYLYLIKDIICFAIGKSKWWEWRTVYTRRKAVILFMSYW
jgi:hypothetical protein